ncbi:unnamed protein product [Durusdinium trenchii]|uniref:tyrosine--tRNA ligase n=1 Tax=Durusdinium trenchii TaxID=1381693 RepID=A0ABP0M8U9_9DINO
MEHDDLATVIQKYVAKRSGPDAVQQEEVQSSTSPNSLSIEERFKLLRSVGEECQTEPELMDLLKRKATFNLYDGFEPSGRMHIAQGLFKSVNVNKCTEAGGIFKFYVADWFALMNDKMGGDLKKIKDTGMYFVHVWKSCGMKMENVRFIWASDFIEENATEYWTKMLDISRVNNLGRVKRCCTIMGREEGNLTAAQILYPLMQCTDIFILQANICQLGVDQRKVNMLAREYCGSVGIKYKPIILSHHMLMGLKAGQAKMSKSDPDSAVFMEDTPEDVRRKITNAACPKEKEKKSAKQKELQGDDSVAEEWVLNNPVIDYVRYLILENSKGRHSIEVDGLTYDEADSLERDFIEGKISEKGLKEACIERLNQIMAACRKHFAEDKEARELVALVEQHKAEVQREKDAGTVKAAPLRSLQVFTESSASASVGVVFAPRPEGGAVTAEEVLCVLQGLVRAKKDQKKRLVLWCEDWSSFTLDRMKGDLKVIAAYFGILGEAVKTMASVLKLEVEVKLQSEEILRNPNMYWISVIDAGRKKRQSSSGEEPMIGLDEVGAHLPAGETLSESGQVVSTLMHVADLLALCRGVKDLTIYSDASFEKHHSLGQKYLQDNFDGKEVCIPKIDATCKSLKSPIGLTLGEGESVWNSKMKKCYCLEGELAENPLMDLLSLVVSCQLLDTSGPLLEVRQKAEHGGDKDYLSLQEVEKSFASKELHPSAFKPAAQDRVKRALAPLQQLKDAAFKKMCTTVDTFIKAQSKKR